MSAALASTAATGGHRAITVAALMATYMEAVNISLPNAALGQSNQGQAISLNHTEVEPAFQGEGLATKLARFSLDDARKRGLAVLPFCPYVNSWIKKHPEYTDLVPEDRRGDFGL